MTRIEFSPESRLDLHEIAAFTARDNPARARPFVREIAADCGKLATWPGIGAARAEFGDGVRLLPHGRYLIFTDTSENWHGFTVGVAGLAGGPTVPEPASLALLGLGLPLSAGCASAAASEHPPGPRPQPAPQRGRPSDQRRAAGQPMATAGAPRGIRGQATVSASSQH